MLDVSSIVEVQSIKLVTEYLIHTKRTIKTGNRGNLNVDGSSES